MISVVDLSVAYDGYQVLWDVDIEVRKGEIVCLLGPNGAGKSTILNTISGLVRPLRGQVLFEGRRIDQLPTPEIIGLGVAHVLERHRVFPNLTVLENLMLGAYLRKAKATYARNLEWVFDLFPVLAEKRAQAARELSGGQQQMLAISRGLMSDPTFLQMDEPFLGLAPVVIEQLLDIFRLINERGVTLLFVEQNVALALRVANRGYVLASGRVVAEGAGEALLANPTVHAVYLGTRPPGETGVQGGQGGQ